MILTLRGKLKKGKVLAIRPNLSVKVINWDLVHNLAGKRCYFNVEPYEVEGVFVGVIVLQWLEIKNPST